MRRLRAIATLLALAALAIGGIGGTGARAQTPPYSPGDLQNRQIVFGGSQLIVGEYYGTAPAALTAAGTTACTAPSLPAPGAADTFVASVVPAGAGLQLAADPIPGGMLWITNEGGNALTLYPPCASGWTINGGASASIPGGVMLGLKQVAIGDWRIVSGGGLGAVTSWNGQTGNVTFPAGTGAGSYAAGNDSRIVGALQTAGGTMTGPLNMAGNSIQGVLAGNGATGLTLAQWLALMNWTPANGATQGGANTAAMYATQAAAVAAGGGTVRIPGAYAGSYTYSYPDPSLVLEWDGPNVNRSLTGLPGVATDASHAFSGVLGTTRPSGNNRALLALNDWSQGSGFNGANHGDFALALNEYKENYTCTTAIFAAAGCSTVALQGENDVLYLAGFQGGPDATSSASLKSAGGLMTGVETCIAGIGFCAQFEFQTSILDPTLLTQTSNIDVQVGGIDTRVGELSSYGLLAQTVAGSQTAAFGAQSSGTGAWVDVFDDIAAGVKKFSIGEGGVFNWFSSGAAQYSMLDSGGEFTIQHSGNDIFELDANGSLHLSAPPNWAAGTVVTISNLTENAGNWYMCVATGGTEAAGSAPVHTSGLVTGADGIGWLFEGTDSNATMTDSVNGASILRAPLYLRAAAQTVSNVPIVALSGTPNGALASPSGGLALRTNGGPGRTLYANESGTSAISTVNWNAVLTASIQDTITAAGTTQGTATPVTSRTNFVTSVPAGTGVLLLGTSGPQEQTVSDVAGNAKLLIYPPSGGSISGLAANAPVFIVGGRSMKFIARASTDIRTDPASAVHDGIVPTLSAGTLNAAGADSHGTVTEGTLATGFVVTFGLAYATAPDCVLSSPSGNVITSYSVSTTTLTVVNASATGDVFTYHCVP